MKSLFLKKSRLSFFFVVLLAVTACKKEESADDQNEALHPVKFQISGFTSQKSLFKSGGTVTQANSNSSNYVEGYLYFWSFNEKTLEPDIALESDSKASITYLKGTNTDERIPKLVGSGYKFEDYAAGGAISCDGPSEILIKMPIGSAENVTQFGFDAGSSNTGPKDFELHYSIDEGKTYEVLQLENQFGDTKDNNKNTYNYQLSDKNITSSQLWFKFLPKEGIRGDGSAYNSTGGAFRFDNIRLVGMGPTTQSGASINKLHYFLFNKENASLVQEGNVDYDEAGDLTLQMAEGKYAICFVSNESAKDLLLPESPTLTSFYVGNSFSNLKAAIFGYVGDLEVNGSMEQQVELQRLFSQVKLEFTDAVDLSTVKKIVISQQHDPFFYAPFNSKLTNPILDQSDVEVTADFNTNKQLIFNQFMGEQVTAVPLKYEVEVHSSTGVLRTFLVGSTLKNNMQLVFRGNLLDQLNPSSKFSISKKTDWGGDKEEEF